MNAEAFALRRRLYIIFKGEEGLDYGGVSRYNFFYLNLIMSYLLSKNSIYLFLFLTFYFFSENGFSC